MLVSNASFDCRTRTALGAARRVAARRHSEHVGTGHILVGLLDDGESMAAAVLERLGVERGALQRAAHDASAPGAPESQSWARLSLFGPKYTARARRALELAVAEAIELGQWTVGSEHLLLGLLRDAGSAAGRALAASGVEYAGARRETLRLLGRPGA